MSFVYIVVENGEAYPMAYTTYLAAVKAVKEKHREYIEAQIRELNYLYDIESVLSNINVPESSEGISNLYIEKGINIKIHKLPY